MTVKATIAIPPEPKPDPMTTPDAVPGPPLPPPLQGWRWVAALLAVFTASGCAGFTFERLDLPLPWMTGPLVITAAVFIIIGPRLTVPVKMRPFGQIVVATQVGLAFSPEALSILFSLAPVFVGTALAIGVSSLIVALLMAKITGQGLTQAFLSAVPTSPVEAATIAKATGFDPVPVIYAQTLRLAAVVLILPFALYAVKGWPEVQRTPVGFTTADPWQIALLVVVGITGAWVFRLLRVPNPFFLGPLIAAATLAASGHATAPYPPMVLAVAQVVLGTWLGATFRRDIVTSAVSLTINSALSAFFLLSLCTLAALGIAAISGVDWRAMLLAAAPGGVVEMALTAKFLQQNVLLITTFHLVRIFVIVPNVPWMVRMLARLERRHTERNPPR